MTLPRQARLHGRMNGEHVAQLEAVRVEEQERRLYLDVRNADGEKLAHWRCEVVRIDVGEEVVLQVVIVPPETKATVAEIVGARG